MWTLLLLARRFLWGTREKSIAVMTGICFMSIILGSCALALVAAVMSGIEKETRAVVQGINPDLIMLGEGKPLNYPKIQEFIAKNYHDSIDGISPSMQGHACIKAPDINAIAALVMLTAIDPDTEQSVSKLPLLIKQPKAASLGAVLENDQLLIGQSLASLLGAKPGDPITLLFAPEVESPENVMLEQRQTHIGGIFKSGIEDIDANVIFLSISLAKSLFPDKGITHIGLKLRNPDKEKEVMASLKKALGLAVFSWKDLYPALLAALTLEKYAMLFILSLIAMVASINIMALLFMYIAYKKAEIAVLRTLGFTSRDVMLLFLLMGTGIGLVGASIGVTLASIASFLLNRYPFIQLPDAYYVSHLPAHMTMPIGATVIILVLAISFIAALIPARYISRLDTAALLKRTV